MRYTFNRREFIKTSLAGAGALAAGSLLATQARAVEPAKTFCGNEIVTLGKSGIQVSRLAQGTGFNGYSRSSDHTRLGQEKFSALIQHSMEKGINLMDMADLYGTHPYVKNAVKGVARDKVVLLSKIWPTKTDWNDASGGAVDEVDRFRKELGVDMIDICLIHCMQNPEWPTKFEKIRDDLSTLKQKGAIRAVGVSCHDLKALKVASEHPWVDVIYARINYKGGGQYAMDGTLEEVVPVLKAARANGKAVIGMKIFGAGKLVKPEEKDASLNFVFKNGLVDAITVGMLKPEQVDDTLERMSKVEKPA